MKNLTYKKLNHQQTRSLKAKRSLRAKRKKMCDTVGVIQQKNTLKCAFLNVDGLSHLTFEYVLETVKLKKPDVLIIAETHRRDEATGMDIKIPGYELHETKRSDLAEDRDGGGLALYTRISEGLHFKSHDPDINDKENAVCLPIWSFVSLSIQTR